MKKLLSVLLSVLILCALAVPAFAATADGEQGYTQIYTVRVGENYAKMISIEPTGEDNTVNRGDNFRFAVHYLGTYRPDATTVIKVYPASYPNDLYFHDDDTTAMITLTPDEYGIYTIENVQEDMYVAVFSVSEKNMASIKDLLYNIVNQILNFFRRLLGKN